MGGPQVRPSPAVKAKTEEKREIRRRNGNKKLNIVQYINFDGKEKKGKKNKTPKTLKLINSHLSSWGRIHSVPEGSSKVMSLPHWNQICINISPYPQPLLILFTPNTKPQPQPLYNYSNFT